MRSTPQLRWRRLSLVGVAVVLGAVGLWLYGVGAGGGFYFKLAQAPFRAAEAAPYYRESVLHVGLAHLLGMTRSILQFRIFVLAWYWLALLVVAWQVAERLRWRDGVLVLLVLTTLPAAMIVHAWTCHPDALTLLLGVMLLTVRAPLAVVGLAVLAAWNHLGMAVVLGIDAAVLWFALGHPQARRLFAALGFGLVLGVVSQRLAFAAWGISVAGRFGVALAMDPHTLLGYWTAPGLAVIYTLFFAHAMWLPAVVMRLRSLVPRGPRLAGWLVLTQVLALAACFVTRDTTRVFAVLSWPALAFALISVLEHRPATDARLRWLLGLGIAVTVASPMFFAWEGRLHPLDGARQHWRSLIGSGSTR